MTIALAALGFTTTIAQVVLIRELVATFYGNELLIGLVLAAWMAWTAAGAWGGARLAARGDRQGGDHKGGDHQGGTAGRTYAWESAGAVAGGLLFSLLFVRYLDPFQTALLLASLNLAVASYLSHSPTLPLSSSPHLLISSSPHLLLSSAPPLPCSLPPVSCFLPSFH